MPMMTAQQDQAAAGATTVAYPEPNFFIVGAPRSGSSSLCNYVRAHPEVFMPSLKEPTFFCNAKSPIGVDTLEQYLALFAGAGGYRAIGEASPQYLGSEESAGLIHARYPHAKILIILRNPVDAAYSLYRLNCSLGVERMPTFERALASEEARFNSEGFKRNNPYFWRSCLYVLDAFTSDHIARYIETFSREQVHVLLLTDFKRRPVETIGGVYRFLGVDPGFVPEFDVRNRSEFPLSVTANRALGRIWWRSFMRRRARNLPKTTADRLVGAGIMANNRLGTRLRANAVEPATRRYLQGILRKDIERTAELIGRDLSDWLR
jgi:hypothetical protein